MDSMIRKLALAAIALTALVVIAAPALGGGPQTVKIDSTITVETDHLPFFHGKVYADIPACKEQRTVELFRRKQNGGRRLLGRDVTNNLPRWRGNWRVLEDFFRGRVLAVVKREKQRDAGTIYVCKRDQVTGRFHFP